MIKNSKNQYLNGILLRHIKYKMSLHLSHTREEGSLLFYKITEKKQFVITIIPWIIHELIY